MSYIKKSNSKKDKQTKENLSKWCNDLWKKLSIDKWGNYCSVCGAEVVSVHHFIPKSKSNFLRYDVANGVPICRKCHWTVHFEKDPLKRRAVEDKIMGNRGADWIDYISFHKNIRVKKNLKWFKDTYNRLMKYELS